MAEEPLHVAIIGGGLCGLALAIGLEKRGVSYTVYEARASFTEIGAGLNLGPNSIHAFNAIDTDLNDKIFDLATRNEAGKEQIWLDVRLGAATERFEDAHFVTSIQAPPTGNMTVSRNEVLQLLAQSVPPERTSFNKKIVDIQQSPSGATLSFLDGSTAEANAVIGSDGTHSAVRRLMLGSGHPAAIHEFISMAGYRDVIPIDILRQAIGPQIAQTGHMICGPGGNIIMYPINRGKDVNVGLWLKKSDLAWNEPNHPWVLHQQKQQMLKDFESWGPVTQKIMSLMSEETQLFGSYHYAEFPERYFDGCVCVIGDAAHVMSPQQGQGAAQAMEDACVLADALQHIDSSNLAVPLRDRIQAAFHGFESARRDRFERVVKTSLDAFGFWAYFHRPDLSQEDLEQFERDAYMRFGWLWDEDIIGQGKVAVAEMEKAISMMSKANGHMNGHVALK